MSKEPDTGPISADTFKHEIREAAGDLQTVSDILVSLSHPDVQIQHGWMSFFGRAIEGIAEDLQDAAGRFE